MGIGLIVGTAIGRYGENLPIGTSRQSRVVSVYATVDTSNSCNHKAPHILWPHPIFLKLVYSHSSALGPAPFNSPLWSLKSDVRSLNFDLWTLVIKEVIRKPARCWGCTSRGRCVHSSIEWVQSVRRSERKRWLRLNKRRDYYIVQMVVSQLESSQRMTTNQ